MSKFSWPLPKSIPVSQPFGSDPYPISQYNPVGGHTGTDIAAPLNTPVHASGDGVIKHSDRFATANGSDNPWWLTSWGGITVVLDCGEVVFVYAHLNSTDMVDGQVVKKGQVIGYTGNTGTIPGMGYHLHFEALPDGWNFNNGTYGRVDPAIYCQDDYSAVDGVNSAASTINILEEDVALTKEEIEAIAKRSAELTWLYDFKRPDGTANKPLWILQSLDAIIKDAVAKTAKATADTILNTKVYDVRTGGTTTLANSVAWQGKDTATILDALGKAANNGDLPAELADQVKAAIDEKVSGLQITLSVPQQTQQ